MAQAPDPALGAFGKYTLDKRLAEGGMAEIFLARQQGPAGFEKLCVIKRILPHLSRNDDFVSMFLDEARLAASLSHPNIVQVFDFGEAEGSYYLCMEYLNGEDLSAIIKASNAKKLRVPGQVVAVIAAAACDALAYAHSMADEDGNSLNLVHRDISPSNIFVTYQGTVKVLDFGIAKAEGKLVQTVAGTVKGKFAYMAPEQARGKPVDGRSDLWAVGVCMHELLTGQRLFHRDNEVAGLQALIHEPIPTARSKAPDTPAELDAIIVKALQRDPALRFQDAGQMRRAIDDYLADRSYVPAAQLLREFLVILFGKEQVAKRSKVTTSIRSNADRKLPSELREAKVTEEIGLPADVDRKAPEAGNKKLLLAGLTGAGIVGVAALGVALLLRSPAPASKPEPGPPPTEQPRPPPKVVEAPTPPPVAKDPEPTPSPPKDPEPAPPPVASPTPTEKPPVATPQPRPKGKPKGKLDLNCLPWCRIYVDGRDTGRNSPAVGIVLTAGTHRLRLVNPPTGVEQERDVVIVADQTTREVVKF